MLPHGRKKRKNMEKKKKKEHKDIACLTYRGMGRCSIEVIIARNIAAAATAAGVATTTTTTRS